MGNNCSILLDLQCVVDGITYLTIDGETKFRDLAQLVDFYQVNEGTLPTKLRNYVTKALDVPRF